MASVEITMTSLYSGDLEFLRRLRNDIRRWLGTKAYITRRAQADWYTRVYANDPNWLVFIAINESNEKVGYGQVRLHDDGSAEIGCAVTPSCQRQGYGYAIVEWLLLYIMADGRANTIWLWVYDDNDAALELYRKAGFKVTSQLGGGKLRMELQ